MLTRYEVFVEAKAQATQATPGVSFIVTQEGYKQAWVSGRALCRLGAENLPTVGGDPLTLEAGKYTVRKVFTLDRKVKVPVVTVDALVTLASERGVKIARPLEALIAELLGEAPGAEADAS